MPVLDVDFVRAQVPALAEPSHGVLRLSLVHDIRPGEVGQVGAAREAAL